MNKWPYLIIAYVAVVLLVFDRLQFAPIFSTTILKDPVDGLEEVDRTNSSYLIAGKDRFQWYKEQLFNRTKLTELKNAPNISLLYAYEFEHEITVTVTSWERLGYRLFCRYLDENDKEIGEPFESFTYPEYIVNCQKREGTRKIGLSVNETEIMFETIPIMDRMLKKPKYEVSMCVASIYGFEPKWLMFIEMIEHFKMQGVQHFYLHIHNASMYDMRVINDYIRTGEVEVHYLIERDYRKDNHWHMVNLADCLIWSRGESKWTIFADLDERIYMTNYTGTILDYVREVQNDTIGSLMFRQQWILKTELMPERYEGDKQINQWMPTHRWHNSTGLGPHGHTAKCIVDTSKVFIMFIHYVTQFFPAPYGNRYVTKRVEAEEGLIRHYRDQSLGSWGQKWLNSTLRFGELRSTDYPEKLIGELTERVKRRAKYVYDNLE
ncbi:hypothetical protein L3Y34_006400 [Caenorhabditis briggsae]|uniref:Glycosyltransferase family 92 protein n=1 Tax=Caenorhabditis briggsae TaxID=6238 RepID=A0AAE9CYU6_CAEBR|nr:hypothetical protein L3Y34_006400 [Caenorhabditis briggsae]